MISRALGHMNLIELLLAPYFTGPKLRKKLD